jgi:hypothetical protein
MYEIDDKDQVVKLTEVPQSSVGAPNPIVVAGEHDVLLTYYLQDTPEGWDGTTARILGTDSEGEPVTAVNFKHCTAHMFGPPNDEAFFGHPLADRGVNPYGVFEVKNSSWIRRQERMNAVHPHHDKMRYMENKKHFIFAFHDTTFECVAEGFTVKVAVGSVRNMVLQMLESVR